MTREYPPLRIEIEPDYVLTLFVRKDSMKKEFLQTGLIELQKDDDPSKMILQKYYIEEVKMLGEKNCIITLRHISHLEAEEKKAADFVKYHKVNETKEEIVMFDEET